jgi:hypothetical protein
MVSTQDRGLDLSSIEDAAVPGYRQHLTSLVTCTEHGKPVFSLKARARRIARNVDGDAGMGCPKKRMLAGNKPDRGAITLTRKGADFGLVLNHEKTCGTAIRRHS